MCPIFVSSVLNFGRSDDAYFPQMHMWFDAQLDQKILDGLQCKLPLKISSYFRLLVEKQDHKIKFVMLNMSELLMGNVMGRVLKIGLVLALFSWVFSCLVLEYRFIFHLEYHMLMTILQEITGIYFFRLWSFKYRKQNHLNKSKKKSINLPLYFFSKFYFHSLIKQWLFFVIF